MMSRLALVSRLVLCLGCFLSGTALAEADQPAPARPRIGLCLAGGGARGGAHVGVLKVLEDLRVPIDCIAGTSIGSIVGGLYATGMSPAAMDSTLSSIVWLELFDDRPPRRLVSFRRKAEDYLPYLKFEVGLGEDGLATPAGAVAGPKLLFLLRALTLSSVGTDSFDDLPIPYRAVAADLADGSLVVIDRGTVADAMRASMAIPGAFTPHVVDGRTLVDGGFLRNVPYEVVKAMGADVVIVVDVGPTFAGLKTDPSLLGILDHTVTMTIVANARESLKQLGDRDLLLTPELGDIGVEDFDRMGETVGQGVSVATAQIDRLRELAVSADEYEAWRSGVRAAGAGREIRIDEVRVESPGRIDPRRVRRRVASSPDAPLDLAVLTEDLARVYRIGEFEIHGVVERHAHSRGIVNADAPIILYCGTGGRSALAAKSIPYGLRSKLGVWQSPQSEIEVPYVLLNDDRTPDVACPVPCIMSRQATIPAKQRENRVFDIEPPSFIHVWL